MESCLLCALKHVAKASAKLDEIRLDPRQYAWTVWHVVGHLSEAEDHLRLVYPAIAGCIRRERLALMDYPEVYEPRLNTILKWLNRCHTNLRRLESDDNTEDTDEL